MTGSVIDEVFVDRGYRGHSESKTAVYISGQRRGIKTRQLKKSLKRRQAIEPVIGHLKSDGLLGCNYLKGSEGDQTNVMLSCAGHNLRLILGKLKIFLSLAFGPYSWQVRIRAVSNAHQSAIKPIFTVGYPSNSPRNEPDASAGGCLKTGLFRIDYFSPLGCW